MFKPTVMDLFVNDENGVTAIEYGLIAALIAVVIIAAVSQSGASLNIIFTKVSDCLSNVLSGSGC